jgi:hypothetical protein
VAERAAAGALLDAAWATSPRVEVVEPGSLCLDLGGLAPLFGDERRIGERLIAAGAAVGLPVRVGIGGTRTLARLAARVAAPLRVVPPGAEEAFLAPRALGLLEPAPDLELAFERWGIGSLGALAALPTAALLARLGPPAVRLQALARGADLGPFVPHLEPEPCREAITLDWEVPSLPALAFILDRLLAQLAARLALRDAGAAALACRCGWPTAACTSTASTWPRRCATAGRWAGSSWPSWTRSGSRRRSWPSPWRPSPCRWPRSRRICSRRRGPARASSARSSAGSRPSWARTGSARRSAPDTHHPDALGMAPFPGATSRVHHRARAGRRAALGHRRRARPAPAGAAAAGPGGVPRRPAGTRRGRRVPGPGRGRGGSLADLG